MSSQVRSCLEYFKGHLNYGGVIAFGVDCVTDTLPHHLRFCVFFCAVPSEEAASVSLPTGLALLDHFVSPEEEASLLSAVDWSSGNDVVSGELQLWGFF